jgi:hypothetical protein
MKPIEVILDTDMATDCDDAGAMAVLHALERAGEARIAAMVVNNKDAASVGAVAAINAFYGRRDIPLGAYQGDAVGATAGEFVRVLAADTAACGHRVRSRADVPTAVDVYRKTLAALPDGSAVIVSIGHLNNLQDLMRSPADEHSPLAGMELIRAKVAHGVMMGGDYPAGKEHNFFARGSDAVTAEVVHAWPTPVLFSGYTLGLGVMTGPGLAALPQGHPVRRAYELHPTRPMERGRPSWDQTAVVAAVRGPGCFWRVSEPGFNRIAADGSNAWESRSGGSHVYLIERDPPAQVAAEIERLMMA